MHNIKAITKQVYKDAINRKINDKHQTETPMIAQTFVKRMCRDDADSNSRPCIETKPAAKRENSENLANSMIKEEPVDINSTVPEKVDENQNDNSETVAMVSLSDSSIQSCGNSSILPLPAQEPDVNVNRPAFVPELQYRPVRATSLAQSFLGASAMSNSSLSVDTSISIISDHQSSNDGNVAAAAETKHQPNIAESRGIKNPAPKGKYRVFRGKMEPPKTDMDANISIFPTATIKTKK